MHYGQDGNYHYHGHDELCRELGTCPEFKVLEGTVVATQGEVKALRTTVAVQQSEIATLNADVAYLLSLNPKPLPPIPFNEAVCRATPIEAFNRTGGYWVFTYPSQYDMCIEPAQKTCTEVCARTSSRCDPCAMSKLNCQNAYFYALTQAQFSNASAVDTATMLRRQAQTPPGSFNWEQSTCANATFNGSSSIGYNPRSIFPGATGVVISCDYPNKPLIVVDYERPINFYNKQAVDSYVDPATICDAPVWVASNPGILFAAKQGVGCYCRN